jgi:hypothetical protein
MPADDKVAFYLRHRLLIEQWTPLREQAVTALETAFDSAVKSVRERRITPEIVNNGTFAYPLYGINLEVPDAGSSQVLVALSWTHGDSLKLSGDSWPYMGIKISNAPKGTAPYDTVKERLQVAAHKHRWTQSDVVGWVWWDYLPPRADEIDPDGYATRQVAGRRAGSG